MRQATGNRQQAIQGANGCVITRSDEARAVLMDAPKIVHSSIDSPTSGSYLPFPAAAAVDRFPHLLGSDRRPPATASSGARYLRRAEALPDVTHCLSPVACCLSPVSFSIRHGQTYRPLCAAVARGS